MRCAPLLAFVVVLGGCAQQPPPNLPAGQEAYSLMPANNGNVAAPDYRIGAQDSIDVAVFQEPDLSAKAIQVDAAGQIALPLVGSVNAKGKTAAELARELEKMYGARYLRNPQVTVTVASSVSQKVSIQGEVKEPGVYQLTGPTTLLDVLSLAKGETELAKLDQVVVFRTINRQRMGAVFDVASIRSGSAADPVIQGNDMVVVGYSAARRFWNNVVNSAGVFNIFRPLGL
ncbi:MAG: polysaccharide biosynthesis/export family protein [Sphingomicrobium sp.]